MKTTVEKRQELDDAMLAFRVARKGKCGEEGWLRGVRQAVGVPVGEVAKRMGVTRWEVHQLELREMDGRIKLETLRKAAMGLDCELVYALVPREGTLEDLAARQKAALDEARAKSRAKAKEKRMAPRKAWMEAIGFRAVILDSMRALLRRQGVRVHPRTTDQGDAESKELNDIVMRLSRLKVSWDELERHGLVNKGTGFRE